MRKDRFLKLFTVATKIPFRTSSLEVQLLFFLRIILGFIFLIAGLGKFLDQSGSFLYFTSYTFLPEVLTGFLTPVVSGLEILLGFCLILGLFTRSVLSATIILILTFVSINTWALLQNVQGNCNCLGNFVPLSHTESLIYDLAMLLMALTLLINHPHAVSLISLFRERRWAHKFAMVALCLVFLVTLIPSASTVSKASITAGRADSASRAAGTAAPYKRISYDTASDWSPRMDNGLKERDWVNSNLFSYLRPILHLLS